MQNRFTSLIKNVRNNFVGSKNQLRDYSSDLVTLDIKVFISQTVMNCMRTAKAIVLQQHQAIVKKLGSRALAIVSTTPSLKSATLQIRPENGCETNTP